MGIAQQLSEHAAKQGLDSEEAVVTEVSAHGWHGVRAHGRTDQERGNGGKLAPHQ